MMNENDMEKTTPMDKVEQLSQNMPRLPLAMAYVPYQKWEKPYDMDVGLERGTLFAELDKPFTGEVVV